MKKLLLLVTVAGTLFSCSEDFLDKQPEDILSTEVFYNNPVEIKAGLIACYEPLQQLYNRRDDRNRSGLPEYLAIVSDDARDSYWITNDYLFKKTSGDSHTNFWIHFYKIIVNSNNIIDVIDKFEPKNAEDERLVNAYRGEASFLRAFAYFNLVRLYGDVPKVVERFEDPNEAIGMGRTAVDEMYNTVIIPDLDYAVANCFIKGNPDLANEEARVTKGAALTILGKVYLTLNDHAKAAETLKKLVVDNTAGAYSLLPDYDMIHASENKFNDESIFEVNYNATAGQPNFLFKWMSNENGYRYDIASGGGPVVMFNLMYEFVEDKDWIDNQPDWTRYTATLDSGLLPGGRPEIQGWPKKYTPEKTALAQYDVAGTDNNYMITRYADALLMYGEALVGIGQKEAALPYFNQVRARAGLAGLVADQLNIEQILHERRLELAFEGHRYFDLVRIGKAIEYISRALMTKVDYDDQIFTFQPIEAYQLLLPIPISEIEKDATLVQNPGY